MFESNYFNFAVAEILDEEDLVIDIEVKEGFLAEAKGRVREIMIEEGLPEGEDLEIFIARVLKAYKNVEIYDLIINQPEEIYSFYESIR